MDSHVCDGSIDSVIQFMKNIQTLPYFKGFISYLSISVLHSSYDTSTYTVFSFLCLFQNQLPDWHLLELLCFSNSQ